MAEENPNDQNSIDIIKEEHEPLNCNQTQNFDSNKILTSPTNCDYEDVDIESINIDDIFNENHCHEDWPDPKGLSLNNSIHAYPVETNRSISINSNALSLAQPQQPRLQFDNKYFFIADILNEEKIYHSQEKYNDSISFVVNNNFVTSNSMINSNLRFVKHNSDIPLCINSYDSNLSYTMTESQSVSLNITKNKAILPLVGSSPSKKSLKIGKSNEQLCLVCCDNATGKHYGVISCEGCKGFFKRTIRNSLAYNCRDFNLCSVDKKLRNRCQACRFQKCLTVGMKREAVQMDKCDKRRKKSKVDASNPPSLASPLTDDSLEKTHWDIISQITSDKLLILENKFNPEVVETETFKGNAMEVISEVVNDHLFSLVTWAKYVPGFSVLDVADQTLLLKMCWGELVIANFSHRSMKLNADVILLRNGLKLIPEIAEKSGIGKLIERIIIEIVHQFRDLKIDRAELSLVKVIILFNPNLKDLVNGPFVQLMRDKLYCCLRKYCEEHYPSEHHRFSKLLLRLPSLRSIAHVTLDHFRFYDIVNRASKASDIDMKQEDGDGKPGTGRIFDFFTEMLQHTDIILDH